MRSCDELGVCAGRTPRCKGCEPLRASVFQGLLGYSGDAIRIMREARGRRILGVGPENKKPPDGESGGPLVDPTQ